MPPTLPNTLTNGTTADASQVMADLNAINAAVDQATVTSLPGSPYDGQEIYYLADATNGIVWHLKYRSGSGSTYKWENVGGPPLATESSANQGAITSATFVDLTPSVTVPLAGDYDVEVWTWSQQNDTTNTNSYVSYKIGATGAVDADGTRLATLVANDSNAPRQIAFRRRKSAISASSALKMQARTSGGNFYPNCNTSFAFGMRVWPVRVG